MTWTPYEYWQSGVMDYELQLQDNRGNFNTITNFSSNSGYTDTTFTKPNLTSIVTG